MYGIDSGCGFSQVMVMVFIGIGIVELFVGMYKFEEFLQCVGKFNLFYDVVYCIVDVFDIFNINLVNFISC